MSGMASSFWLTPARHSSGGLFRFVKKDVGMLSAKIAVALLALAGLPFDVSASSPEQPATQEATTEEAVEACGSIDDQVRRLECFDSLRRALRKDENRSIARIPGGTPGEKPADSRQIVIVRKDQAAAVAFRPSPFASKLIDVQLRLDKIFIKLENGETWKQTSRDRPPLPKRGQTATFVKGLMGGWLVSFGENSGKHSFSLVD